MPLLLDAIDRFTPLGMSSMAGDARLRLVENALLAGMPFDATWWPVAADIDDDVVVQIYADRLRGVEALVCGERALAVELAEATVERAREAQVPFDLVLALRVRRAATGSDADELEIAAIHARLGIDAPPPVVPDRLR